MKHNDQKSEQGRRHRVEGEELRRKHENELAYAANHHSGRSRGDREREKERRSLADRHQREHDDLAVRLDREMATAKAKAAEALA